MRYCGGFPLGSVLLLIGLLGLSGCTAYTRGVQQARNGDHAAAAESFAAALREDPGNWQARQQLAFAYLKTGRADKAVDEFEKVLSDRPGDPFSTYHLGLAHLESGRRGQAIAAWERYRNPAEPRVEQELKRQLTLVEVYDSIRAAREALDREKSLAAVSPREGSIAVFAYQDLSPDRRFRHLQKAMAALITTDLAQVKSLTVVERLKADHLQSEMKLAESGLTEKGTAPRAGRMLGAENLVIGTMGAGSLAAKTSIASTTRQSVKASFSVKTETERFFVLEKEIVYNILTALDVPLTAEEQARIRGYHTRDLNAMVFFGQGLEAWDEGRWGPARRSFGQAVEADPDFELARRFRDGCPSATAPNVAALAAMGPSALAGILANDMTEAVSEQGQAAAEAATGPGVDPAGAGVSEPQGNGGVSFSW
jgi:tetratricopeptide (TPR) repeat protein